MEKRQRPIVYKVPSVESPIEMDVNGKKVKVISPRVRIPNEDVIIDENGNSREVRYIAGAKSIFVDEQLAAKYERKRAMTPIEKVDLTLENGFILVHKQDKPLLYEYLEAVNYNGSNERRTNRSAPLFIREYKEKDSALSFDTEIKIHEAKAIIIAMVKDKNGDAEMRKVASAILGDVDGMESYEIREKLMKMASDSPDKVLNATKIVHNDIDEVISEAERLGVIQIQGVKTIWVEGGETILTYKAGTIAKEKLKDHLMKSENSSKLATLREVVKEKKLEEAKSQVVTA